MFSSQTYQTFPTDLTLAGPQSWDKQR